MFESTTISIKTPKHCFKNFNEARKWAKENIVGTYRNQSTGENIYIAKKAINKYLSASSVLKSINQDIHQSVLKILPRLIETALLKETHDDKDGNYHVVEIQRFYGVINYEGSIYPVKITIKVIRNEGNKAYSFEVLPI